MIIAAPPDKIQYIGPKMEETLLVLTDEKLSFVEEYIMQQVEKKILNKLLDTYENSKLLRGDNKVAIHISSAFTKKNLPEYFDESSTVYEEIHAAAMQMQTKGFIEIVWKNNKVKCSY